MGGGCVGMGVGVWVTNVREGELMCGQRNVQEGE
jgi:hypothetical protein